MNKIVVIGDAIQDTWIDVEPNGTCQEDPARIKWRETGYRQIPGGAYNVALQIGGLIKNLDNTEVVGLVGNKECFKTRYVHNQQTLICRVDRDQTSDCLTQEEIEEATEDATAVVISDYEKGSLSQFGLFDDLDHLRLFIDCKNPEKYPQAGAFYFPNEAEYVKNQNFRHRNCLVTRGANNSMLITDPKVSIVGDLVHRKTEVVNPLITQHPVSVVGAGDIVVAAFTVASLVGLPIHAAAEVATVCASIAVTKPYTPNITLEELDEVYRSNRNISKSVGEFLRLTE